MKKASLFTIYLALFIVLLFGVAMMMTFVNDWLQSSGFFGDSLVKPHQMYGTLITTDGDIDQTHTWGARHYWYHTMCVLLFLLSIARIVLWAVYYWEPKNESK